MASLSYINLLYLNSRNIIFWVDGVCSKFILKKYKKTAGRKIIEQIKIPENIENIYLWEKKVKIKLNILKKIKKNNPFFHYHFLKIFMKHLNLE